MKIFWPRKIVANLTFYKKYVIIYRVSKNKNGTDTGRLTFIKKYDIIIMGENNNKPTGFRHIGRLYGAFRDFVGAYAASLSTEKIAIWG
jgi:hypothetical protein